MSKSDQTPDNIPSNATDDTHEKPRSVAKSAGIVSIAVMFSRVFGLIRETVFAAFFGSGYINDAFNVAFKIPNLLRDLFAEGSLSVAFVKVFTHFKVHIGEDEAKRLAILVFNGVAVVLGTITLLGILLAPYFVPMLAKGFSPEKLQLTITLTRIMFPFILLVALAAVAMGILNTEGRFGIPASASTAFNIVSLTVGVSAAYLFTGGDWTISDNKQLVPEMPAQWAITGMAIGTVFGGLAQIAIQLPSLYKLGFRFKPILSFADDGVRRVMRLMGPAVIGTSAIQIKVLFDVFLVSGIAGGNSWLPQSFRLMQLPIGVFGVAIGVAALPTLAKLGSQNKIKEFRSTLSDSLGLTFLFTIPAACGLVVLGEPIVRLIFERGAFKAIDTNMVAWSLAAYSIGLAGYAAIKVLSPSFFALDDAKTPMFVSVASILVHIFFSYTLVNYLKTVGVSVERPTGYGHVGVALSTSIVALVNFVALTLLMRRKIERIQARKIIATFVRIAIASAIMSIVCYFSYHYLTGYFGAKTFLIKVLEAFIPISLGAIVFFAAAKILGVKELDQLVNIFRNKLAR